MNIAAGIIGLLIALRSFFVVSIFGGFAGATANWLGSFGPGANGMSNWGERVQMLSWTSPTLALVGGAVAFASPGLASVILGAAAISHWYLLGFGPVGNQFVLPLAAAALLAFADAVRQQHSSLAPVRKPRQSEARKPSEQEDHVSFDRRKWNALLQYDADVASAAEQVRPLGEEWVEEMASAYLALNDKAYLSGIVDQIVERSTREKEARRQTAMREAEERKQRLARLERHAAELKGRHERAAWARKASFELWRERLWGTTRKKLFTLGGVAVALALIALTIPKTPLPRAEDNVVWNPSDISEVARLNCGGSESRSENCLSDYMKSVNATPEAVRFTQSLGENLSQKGRYAYAESFYRYGPVDAVKIVFPFESQGIENEDFLLVNGSSRMISVNELVFSASLAPNNQTIFSSLLAKYPAVTVWPGVEFISENNDAAGGGQRFVFRYPILNGCHACEQVGTARFALDFDTKGRFTAVSVIAVDEKP